jgi:hypothetical protein
VITTALLLVTVVALVWYGSAYLLPAPATAFARGPFLTRVTTTEADFAWQYAVARLAAAEHPALFLSSGDNAYLLAAPPFLDRAIFRPLHGLLAQAPAVPIPDSQRAFPGTNCGSGDRGPTGSGPSVQIPFGTNAVTITGGNGFPLCIFDGGTMIVSASGGLDNTQPNFMTANTIVQDTLKDLRLVFDRPVQAVAFWLLTNNTAQEVATFKDVGGNVIDSLDMDRFTPRNDRAFVGFISRKPFKEIYLAINVGTPGQNEGLQAIKIAETVAIPARLASDE